MNDEPSALDDLEQTILYYLQDDARNTTNSEISNHVNVSATTVGQRIEDMEAKGIIKEYLTAIDYERAGFPHRVLVVGTVDPTVRHEIALAALDIHGVTSVRELLAGTQNLHIEVVGRARDDIRAAIVSLEEAGIEVVDSVMVQDEHSNPFDHFNPG